MERTWEQFYDEGVPASIDYPETTLYRLFEDAVRRSPQREATLFYGARLRYRQLGTLIDRFAAALSSLGAKRGDRVALILPNIPLYPIAHLASMKLGCILVPTNPLYVERELEYQLNNSGAETVVASASCWPKRKATRGPHEPVGPLHRPFRTEIQNHEKEKHSHFGIGAGLGRLHGRIFTKASFDVSGHDALQSH